MLLHLVDLNEALVHAWRAAFADMPDVTVRAANILTVATCAIVSPANSHAHMDGGIDADYAAFFGFGLQRAVYDAVARRPEGNIPVGAAEFVETGHARIPYLILAPTMEMPEEVSPSNCYRALKAALRVAALHADRVTEIYCPGLATGIGRVEEDEAAHAMAEAYRDWRQQAVVTR